MKLLGIALLSNFFLFSCGETAENKDTTSTDSSIKNVDIPANQRDEDTAKIFTVKSGNEFKVSLHGITETTTFQVWSKKDLGAGLPIGAIGKVNSEAKVDVTVESVNEDMDYYVAAFTKDADGKWIQKSTSFSDKTYGLATTTGPRLTVTCINNQEACVFN